jgi:hypothetical protein
LLLRKLLAVFMWRLVYETILQGLGVGGSYKTRLLGGVFVRGQGLG